MGLLQARLSETLVDCGSGSLGVMRFRNNIAVAVSSLTIIGLSLLLLLLIVNFLNIVIVLKPQA